MKKHSLTTLLFVGLGFVIYAAPAFSGPPANDTCIQGYVWREAFRGDHVCVTPETRTQAAYDNKMAGSRYQKGGGAYGPDTCIQGYVWREAGKQDHVCVTPATRSQTAYDNKMAGQRVVRNVRAPVDSRVAGDNRFTQQQVARTTNIMCPVQQVRAEITSSIPSPWWQTPQVGGIMDTSVQNIGGKLTLVCRYRAYGSGVSLMREMPAGYSRCTAVHNGFTCSQ